MTAVCPHCSRYNPTDAAYCYHDGVALTSTAIRPVDVARQAFPSPLFFPSGRVCHNFDELAQSCDQLWDEAATLLQKGYLQAFFGSLGRLDLAQATEEAAAFPDPTRGLDQLLSRFPGSTLAAAKLVVANTEVALGKLHAGQDHAFEIALSNKGRRLIYGSVSADADWLAVADSPPRQAWSFRFPRALSVLVRVCGTNLRAGPKPLEATLLIQSNAGTFVVRVLAEVQALPFAEGVLAGARTPRDLATKARQAPNEAAPLFESGTVARWYEANGWTYPVQGPTGSGLGAVQQFFEALGLVKPPRVAVSPRDIRLSGAPGTLLRQEVRVFTDEARAVYAHGTSAAPWLTVPPAQRMRAQVLLPVEIRVPDVEGAEVSTMLHIAANGNQCFDIPVRVTIDRPVPPPADKSAVRLAEPPVPARAASFWRELLPLGLLALPLLGLVLADLVRDLPRPQKLAVQDEVATNSQPATFKAHIEDEAEEWTGKAARGPVKVVIVDETPQGALAEKIDPAALVKYALGTTRSPPALPEPPKHLQDPRNAPNAALREKPLPGRTRVATNHNDHRTPLNFGLSTTAAAGTAKDKLLTWSAAGISNSTLLRLDDNLIALGNEKGRWVRVGAAPLTEGITASPHASSPSQSTWVVGGGADGSGGLRIHLVLEVVPGQAILVAGRPTRRLDTVLVRFVFDNRDRKAHKIALRQQLDTLIGQNDGVPFTVPGRPGLVSTSADFRQAQDVPDFIQALERPNLQDPGTIAHLTAKVGGAIEPPDRLSLTFQQWWNLGVDVFKTWDFPIYDMLDDSAVILYWSDKTLPAGAKRAIGFSYGLGQLASSEKLAVTLGGSFEPGRQFTVTAYVRNPTAGQKLRLELPEGLKRLSGAEVQDVPRAGKEGTSLVTWHARVEHTGTFRLVVHSSTGLTQAKTINIAPPDNAAGTFQLQLDGDVSPGKAFGVVAKVERPVKGQKLTLQLPEGMRRVKGEPVQSVPSGGVVRWQVEVAKTGHYLLGVHSSTGLTQRKTLHLESAGGFTFELSGEIRPGKDFALKAQVVEPMAGQTLTLVLPAELKLAEGEARQVVPKSGAVAWRVHVLAAGRLPVRVESSTGQARSKVITLSQEREGALFGR
jgi:predicted secreted protein